MSNRQLELFEEMKPINDEMDHMYSLKYQMSDTSDYNVTINYDESRIEFDEQGVEVQKPKDLTNINIYKLEIAQMQQALYNAYNRIKELTEELSQLKQGNEDA